MRRRLVILQPMGDKGIWQIMGVIENVAPEAIRTVIGVMYIDQERSNERAVYYRRREPDEN